MITAMNTTIVVIILEAERHSISNQGILEIINNTHAVPAGNQASYSFYNDFTANEHLTTNCTDQMIIKGPALNDGNYAIVPDSITEHISNNGYTEIVNGIAESTLRDGYTAFINVITEPTLHNGKLITTNDPTAPKLNN